MKFYTSELMPEMHGISGPVLAYPVAARPRYPASPSLRRLRGRRVL